MDVGFIGTGNMGGALIRGYADSSKKNAIHIYDKDQQKISDFKNISIVEAEENLFDLVNKSSIIILAVKPNIFESILPQIKETLGKAQDADKKIIVSIAAGISIDYLKKGLGMNTKVIRTMPNLNSMVGQGMTAISRDSLVNDSELTEVIDIFKSVGKTATVNEDMMDTVIGVSGSSPAYAFIYMDALIECAVKNGMEKDDATIFAAQSTLGAAVTVMESGIDPGTLTKNVCSPGGTTIEAVDKLNELNFKDTIEQAMTAAIEKSKKMTK